MRRFPRIALTLVGAYGVFKGCHVRIGRWATVGSIRGQILTLETGDLLARIVNEFDEAKRMPMLPK